METTNNLVFPELIFDFEETVPDQLRYDFVDVRADNSMLSVDAPFMKVIEKECPRIFQQIQILWGTQDLQNRLAHWTIVDQESRKGWSKKVYNALMQLSIAHAEKFNLESNVNWDAKSDKW